MPVQRGPADDTGLCVRTCGYLLAIGIPLLLLLAITSGVRLGGNASYQKVDEWANTILEEAIEEEDAGLNKPSPQPETKPDTGEQPAWAGWDAVVDGDEGSLIKRKSSESLPTIQEAILEEWARSLVKENPEDTVEALKSELPKLLQKVRMGAQPAAEPLADVSYLLKRSDEPDSIGIETRLNLVKAQELQDAKKLSEQFSNMATGDIITKEPSLASPSKKKPIHLPKKDDPALEEPNESITAALDPQVEAQTETGDGPYVGDGEGEEELSTGVNPPSLQP
eukprot:9495574-Pyramimonas_sp.AAC.3